MNACASPSETTVRPGALTLQESDDRLIRDAECERLSGLSRTTRWRLERRGRFPRRRQISDNAVGWLLSEILAWRKSLKPKHQLTSELNEHDQHER
jgi:prophage regulatory protein